MVDPCCISNSNEESDAGRITLSEIFVFFVLSAYMQTPLSKNRSVTIRGVSPSAVVQT
jgi:hypothetical protein